MIVFLLQNSIITLICKIKILKGRFMHTIIRIFFITVFALLLPNLSFAAMPGDQASALQFHYEIIELNSKPFWILQYGDQMLQIPQKTSTIDSLLHYKLLLDQASSLVYSVFAYSFFILLMLTLFVFILFTKPIYLKHPFFILGFTATVLATFMLFSHSQEIMMINENLRYYFLLIESINSIN